MKEKLLLIEMLDSAFKLIRLATILVVLLFMLIFAFGSTAQAISIEDLFMVPVVKSTGSGAMVFQPQTGAGLNRSNTRNLNAVGLEAADAPIMPNFQQPQYDAFSASPENQEPDLSSANQFGISTDNSSFDLTLEIYSNMPGTTVGNFGTTATTFTMVAKVNNFDTRNSNLEYRFDYDGDGKTDSYFSTINKISRYYQKPGLYQVSVEVLDQNGKISRASNQIIVVQNDKPFAQFTANEIKIPRGTIVRFDSSNSFDNQYASGLLSYRFDWNNDGIFDTAFQLKSAWYHMFNEPGSYFVVMEAKDPEGLSAQAGINITVEDNYAPFASVSVNMFKDNQYLLDASASTDDHTPLNRLKFRWDYNYSGENDITFDSAATYSPKQTVVFKLGGSKKVRLQVIDEGGLVDEKVIELDVPWSWSSLNMSEPLV